MSLLVLGRGLRQGPWCALSQLVDHLPSGALCHQHSAASTSPTLSPSTATLQQPACSTSAAALTNPWLQGTAHVRTAYSYSRETGTPKPQPWPTIEPVQVKRGDEKGYRWQKTVLRPPPEIQITRKDSVVTLTGKAGSVNLDLHKLDPTGTVAFRLLPVPLTEPASSQASTSAPSGTAPAPTTSTGSGPAGPSRWCVLLASPSQERFKTVVDAFQSAIQGALQGYLIGLTVKGVGYRIEPADEAAALSAGRTRFSEQVTNDKINIQYPYKQPVSTLRLRVGFSRPVIYVLPEGVRAFCLKPTLTYLYGLEKNKLDALAQQIRKVRKPNAYTGNGIQIVGEVIKLKQRTARGSRK